MLKDRIDELNLSSLVLPAASCILLVDRRSSRYCIGSISIGTVPWHL